MANGAEEYYGEYLGRLILIALSDGRLMQVGEPFGFIDKAKKRWLVPVDTKVDGASIPQPLWALVGSPFTGKYRDASVVHDYYCDTRSEPWRDVHRLFYNAMRVSGVSKYLAKLMFAAVYFAGPRWADKVVHNVRLPATDDPSLLPREALAPVDLGVQSPVDVGVGFTHKFLGSGNEICSTEGKAYLNLEKIQKLIESEDPSVAEIERALDRVRPPGEDNDGTRTLIGLPVSLPE